MSGVVSKRSVGKVSVKTTSWAWDVPLFVTTSVIVTRSPASGVFGLMVLLNTSRGSRNVVLTVAVIPLPGLPVKLRVTRLVFVCGEDAPLFWAMFSTCAWSVTTKLLLVALLSSFTVTVPNDMLTVCPVAGDPEVVTVGEVVTVPLNVPGTTVTLPATYWNPVGNRSVSVRPGVVPSGNVTVIA